MADKHNSNIPALGNQIANDIPDIKENLEFHKDAFERLFETWSDTDNSSNVMSTIGFSDSTYTIDFPTNGMANAKFMLGNSSTVAWFYLNSAPPGWKALSTGGDTVLAVAGGTGDYNTTGGSAAGAWDDMDLEHNHQIFEADTDTGWQSNGSSSVQTNEFQDSPVGADTSGFAQDTDYYTINDSPSDSAWRPSASVGKLFQLDTA